MFDNTVLHKHKAVFWRCFLHVLVLSFYGMAASRPVLAADAVGKVEYTEGAATVVRQSRETTLRAGDGIFQNDELSTHPGSKLLILFVDGTHASLGENADLVVDSFVYTPGGGENNGALKIISGAARFVAGQLEKADAKALKIETPVASIGIRGTDFFIEARGSHLAVALFSGFTVGVTNEAGTTVLQPGQGTDVIGTNAPTAARPWAPDRIDRAQALTSFAPTRKHPLPYLHAPAKGASLAEALIGGVPAADLRIRTESVDRDSSARTGEATTARLRLGYETLAVDGFYAGLSGEITRDLARPVSNNGVNGRTDLPLIADPSAAVLHEAYLGWVDRGSDGLVQISIIAGRQRLLYENERWVGPSEFRQNAQSFDAVSAETRVLPGLGFRYAYLWQINRILGNNVGGRWDSASHLISAITDVLPYGVTTAYSYLIDLKPVPQFSSATNGVRYEGAIPVTSIGGSIVAATLEAEFARQSQYGNNPNHFDLTYSLLQPGLTWNGTTFSAGWEQLRGNGTVAVQTPLATLFRQNGWADVFTVTPPRGLRDIHVRWMQELPDAGPFKMPKLDLRYLDFASAGGQGQQLHYGREFDADLNAAISKYFTVGIRAAHYSAIAFGATTTKLWGYVEVHY